MTIAVNTAFLNGKDPGKYEYFIYEIFRRITQTYSQHQFIFLFDRPYHEPFVFEKNVKTFIIGPATQNPLFRKFRYDIKIPAALKKYNADVLVSCDGCCSLGTAIPQCVLFPDYSFLPDPAVRRSNQFFNKRYLPRFLNKAKTILVLSTYAKNEMIAKYGARENKIDVLPPASPNRLYPLTEEEKNDLKHTTTDGKEYFLSSFAISTPKNLTSLLRAFSIFKKKQASNWKLVLLGKPGKRYSQFSKDLKNYKYRGDVIMVGDLTAGPLSRIIGSAYAIVFPSSPDDPALSVLEAISSGTPVIAPELTLLKEIIKDDVLFIDPSDINGMAEKMMLLYKDEELRRRVIEKGRLISKQYSMERSAESFWQTIIKTVSRRADEPITNK